VRNGVQWPALIRLAGTVCERTRSPSTRASRTISRGSEDGGDRLTPGYPDSPTWDWADHPDDPGRPIQ
jgi:hypothetical protein